MKIVTVTDGSQTVAITLQIFFASLYLKNSKHLEVDVVCPKEDSKWMENLIEVFSQEVTINKVAIPFGKFENRYYAKLMLKKYLDTLDASQDEDIVYLDYDHVFGDPINLNITNIQCVYLSSETEPISSALLPFITPIDNQEFPPFHYNTSLIIGRAATLAKSMESWEEIYAEYQDVVSPRYIEEVSFCGAATAQGINIVPISSYIQSNWQNKSLTWQMFHYGGEYKRAKKLKEFIPIFLGNTISGESKKKAFQMAERIVKFLLLSKQKYGEE